MDCCPAECTKQFPEPVLIQIENTLQYIFTEIIFISILKL